MSRHVYVTLAEAIRTAQIGVVTAEVEPEAKKEIATVIADALANDPEVYDFDRDRFLAHALAETDEKWAYNKANGGYVPESEDVDEPEKVEEDEATGDDTDEPVIV